MMIVDDERKETSQPTTFGTYTQTCYQAPGFTCGRTYVHPSSPRRLIASETNSTALLELRPELAEVLELDQVPDGAEGRVDDGRLVDGGGGRNGRHCEEILWGLGVGICVRGLSVYGMAS